MTSFPRRDYMRDLILVGIGGFIGAILRYALSSIIQSDGSAIPVGTLLVNFLGTFLLGMVVYSAELVSFITPDIRIFLTIGVLGAFTTMSTFGHEAFTMFEEGRTIPLLVYVIATVLLVFLGIFVAKISVNTISGALQVSSP
ncbi:MAG: fluoride efflux transporter CrcB [Candidatus Thorarchaeota archaeon]|nr:MAG: fluoride efflux transporter CrcB [Candidatus Thorarchaeota archaeon]